MRPSGRATPVWSSLIRIGRTPATSASWRCVAPPQLHQGVRQIGIDVIELLELLRLAYARVTDAERDAVVAPLPAR